MKRTGTFTLTFIAICIALNFIGANIALFLRLPIYLDTIGTLVGDIDSHPQCPSELGNDGYLCSLFLSGCPLVGLASWLFYSWE